MAAPLCYLVGVAVALAVQRFAHRRDLLCLALTPFALLSLEGMDDSLSFQRDETITVRRVVLARPGEVEACLSRVPRFVTGLPGFFRIGSPDPSRPVAAAWRSATTVSSASRAGKARPET